jgi:hypothetical protein
LPTAVASDINRWGIGFVGSLIDAERDRFVFAGTHSYAPREAPAFGMWHIGQQRYEDKALTGEGAQHFAKGSYSGLTHDTINDKYLFLDSGSGKVLSINPDSFVTNLITQAPPAVNGCQNRVAFIPALGGYLYLPEWKSHVLFLPVEQMA